MIKLFSRAVLLTLMFAVPFAPVWAADYDETIRTFKDAGESGEFFGKSYGYAVFPTIGKGGFGIGGTATFPGPVSVTMQNAPWTIGQPTMTLHTPNSTITTPWIPIPGGFAHGGRSHVNGDRKQDDARARYLALSLGMPLGSNQSLKVTYLATNTHIAQGSNTDTLVLGWSMNWGL